MKLLLDTNVVVDYLHVRKPFFEKARLLMILGFAQEFELWITSSQMTDLVYILTEGGKQQFMQEALRQLRNLRQFVNVFSTGETEVDKMLLSTWKDPEDFLLYQCALSLKADAIITRNKNDFEEQSIKVCNCEEFFDWVYENQSVRYAIEKLGEG